MAGALIRSGELDKQKPDLVSAEALHDSTLPQLSQ
jgi:hypothetical protein